MNRTKIRVSAISLVRRRDRWDACETYFRASVPARVTVGMQAKSHALRHLCETKSKAVSAGPRLISGNIIVPLIGLGPALTALLLSVLLRKSPIGSESASSPRW